MSTRTFLVLLASMLLASCGGVTISSASGGATGSGGGSTGSGGGPADGGCITPTVGEPCSSNETACQPVNPCCTGYEWMCQSGAWQQAGLGCACQAATPFACGPSTCQDGSYCQEQSPGVLPVDGGDSGAGYTCQPVPSSCLAAPTCACIQATLPAQSTCSPTTFGTTCTEDTDGHVTLHCAGV